MYAILPFVLQGLLMLTDELYCHRRRRLRRWERVGHPLDALSFLFCLLWLLLSVPSVTARAVYAGLALASCLLISKDEWQHTELCTGFESWLHALLFMLHPTLLIWAGWLWWSAAPVFTFVIGGAAALTALFILWQTLFWNVWTHDRQ